jgi:hypothetical protein
MMKGIEKIKNKMEGINKTSNCQSSCLRRSGFAQAGKVQAEKRNDQSQKSNSLPAQSSEFDI